MRLTKVQEVLKKHQCPFTYTEEDSLGSIDFVYRGISYHIWEFSDGDSGVETNLRNAGRSEDLVGENYEETLVALLEERLVS